LDENPQNEDYSSKLVIAHVCSEGPKEFLRGLESI